MNERLATVGRTNAEDNEGGQLGSVQCVKWQGLLNETEIISNI